MARDERWRMALIGVVVLSPASPRPPTGFLAAVVLHASRWTCASTRQARHQTHLRINAGGVPSAAGPRKMTIVSAAHSRNRVRTSVRKLDGSAVRAFTHGDGEPFSPGADRLGAGRSGLRSAGATCGAPLPYTVQRGQARGICAARASRTSLPKWRASSHASAKSRAAARSNRASSLRPAS